MYLRRVAYTVILLTLLCLYSGVVRHATLKENRDLGIVLNSVNVIAKFPRTVKDVLVSGQLFGVPPTYVQIDSTFEEINELEYDLYGLNSFYSSKNNNWEIQLFNFRDDSVIHSWFVESTAFKKTYKQFANTEPREPILLPDKSVIALLGETNNLLRLDSASNIVWHNTQKYYHHTMNLATDGNIWVCSSTWQSLRNSSQSQPRYYRDDYITKVDINSGEILIDKSISEILIENSLKTLLFSYSNEGHLSEDTDPLHLNDIECAYVDSPNYDRGDLFLSFRHRSTVIQYRPSNNKVIRVISGPFMNQHDADIISPNEISIFNNNVISFGDETVNRDFINTVNEDLIAELTPSSIVKYKLDSGTFSLYGPDVFAEEEITTLTQGLHQFLSNGDVFVESQNDGKVYILNEEKVKFRKYFKADIDGMAHQTHWVRIYESINFLTK